MYTMCMGSFVVSFKHKNKLCLFDFVMTYLACCPKNHVHFSVSQYFCECLILVVVLKIKLNTAMNKTVPLA